MDTPDFEHGRVYFKQFGAERVKDGTVSTDEFVYYNDLFQFYTFKAYRGVC